MRKMLILLVAFLLLLISPGVIKEPYISIEHPKKYAERMALLLWDEHQWRCLHELWQRESKWNPRADNPKSTAYGIPQILGMPEDTPILKQIDLGLAYVEHRYDTPCKALVHHLRRGWY